MKPALFTLFFLAYFNCLSQTWGPGTKWIYDQEESTPTPGFEYVVIRYEKDTLIQGFDCDQFTQSIYETVNYQVDSFSAGQFILRRQDEKVWFYEPEDSNFYLLYDFSLDVGDTLYTYGSISGVHEIFPLKITAVSTIQIGNETRKVQTLGQLESGSFRMEGDVIEEIGWDEYLFPRPGFVDPAFGGYLLCYTNNGFQYPETGVCAFPLVIDDPAVYMQDVQVAPNPASDIVRVKADSGAKPDKLRIFSLDGRLLAVSEGDSINVSKLPSGMYLLKITWPGEKETFSKLMRF